MGLVLFLKKNNRYFAGGAAGVAENKTEFYTLEPDLDYASVGKRTKKVDRQSK